MAQDLQKVRSDVWTWRVIAVFVWQLSCLVLASLFCKSLVAVVQPRSWSFGGLVGACVSSFSSATCLELLQAAGLWSYSLILAVPPPQPSDWSHKKLQAASSVVTSPPIAVKSAFGYWRARLLSGTGCLLSASLAVAAESWLRSAVQPVGEQLIYPIHAEQATTARFAADMHKTALQGQAWLSGIVLGAVHAFNFLARSYTCNVFATACCCFPACTFCVPLIIEQPCQTTMLRNLCKTSFIEMLACDC